MNDPDRKYFTVEEANRTLPLVNAIVRDIVELFSDIHERRERLARVRQVHGRSRREESTPYSEELEEIEDAIDRDIERLEAFCDELRSIGVELKDPSIGLIDFYGKMDGRDVYLCWKLGESEISYWHELDAGFAGRQSLLQDTSTGTGDKSEGV